MHEGALLSARHPSTAGQPHVGRGGFGVPGLHQRMVGSRRRLRPSEGDRGCHPAVQRNEFRQHRVGVERAQRASRPAPGRSGARLVFEEGVVWTQRLRRDRDAGQDGAAGDGSPEADLIHRRLSRHDRHERGDDRPSNDRAPTSQRQRDQDPLSGPLPGPCSDSVRQR